MSYRLEGRDIVLSGLQEGIADSPYLGIGDMRNVNIISAPGEADVNFKTSAMTLPPAVSALAFSATDTDDLFTVASTSGWYNGMAIVLNTWTGTGPSTGVVYYVRLVSATTFKIYRSPFYALVPITVIAVTGDGTGTLTSYTMAKPIDKCTDNGEFFSGLSASYIIDSKNQVWVLTPPGGVGATWPASTAIFCGNISSTIVSGPSSICVWNGYLFLFRQSATDYWDISNQAAPASNWAYGWGGLSTSGTTSRKCLVSQDNAIYICNGASIASLLENPNETFDPTDSTTYTANTEALILPEGEVALCLAELGVNLLVGGKRTFVYPWDRVSPSYTYPLVVPEPNIAMILSTNSNAYIFAGNRGRIYITNGANIDLFKKIPDYISGSLQPYYTFGGNGGVNATTANGSVPNGDGIYWRNQLYFSMTAKSNAGTTLTTVVGIWAIDLDSGALRMVNKMSYDAYSGTISVILPILSSLTPAGEGLFSGWVDANGNVGVDNSSTGPYENYETYIDFDIVPVGTFLDQFTPTQVEWKIGRPLVSGEEIRLSYRTNLTDSFTTIGTSTDAALISDMYQVNFQKTQWVQLRVEYSSTSSSPSYVPLTEVRLRDWSTED